MSFFNEKEKTLYRQMKPLRKIRFILGKLKRRLALYLTRTLPFLKPVHETRSHNKPITIEMWFAQKILGINRHVYWPVHFTSVVVYPQNVYAGIDTSPGYSHGCYIQAIGKVYIDDYTSIGPNVGIISSNHEILDFRKHKIGQIKIGKYCWIGMNSVILPDVTLGDFTTVMAGSVVNTSFPEGYCVIGGNPAKLLKQFPEESKHLFTRYSHDVSYNGYIRSDKFEAYRKKKLRI